MAIEWAQARIGDISHRVTKGTTPTTVGGRFVKAGIAFVKVESITDDGRLDTAKFAYIDDETNRLLSRSVLQEDDILFTIAGTIGRVARVSPDILPANTNQAVAIVRPNRELIDSRFLYYALRDELRIRHAHTRVVQSVQANFSLTELSETTIPLPEKREQRAIAQILGSLDDKIELNRQMNETLKAMVRAIFLSWFVEFNPVRAKADGRDPAGLDRATEALFPDDLQNSPLGVVPTGWCVGKLHELLDLSRDVLDPSQCGDEVFDHYSIPAFDEGRAPKAESGAAIKSNKFIVPANAVLLSKLNPRIPRVWIPTTLPGRRAICSTEFLVAVPRGGVAAEYLYGLFTSRTFLDSFETMVTGTSGSHQRVKPEYLLAMDAVIPAAPAIMRYTKIVRPLLQRTLGNVAESQTLAAIREALLPSLLSGEIRLKDAERVLEAAS